MNAKLTCQNFGMELLAPESEEEDADMRKALKASDNPTTEIIIGITAKGNDDSYYSINSGRLLTFDFSWRDSEISPYSGYECLKLYKDYFEGDYFYNIAKCYDSEYRFICQKTFVPGKFLGSPVN